jgi:citrate synthase
VAARYLTADEAAAALGVTKNTLYAYVSRGLVRSEPDATRRRTRRYHAEDVERLKRRQRQRQQPERAVREALSWEGLPVLDSALTLIDGGRCFYRGHDACTLARRQPFEAVAALLWLGTLDADALPEVTPPDVASDAVFVLCADHEFNVPAFVTRAVASAEATPYGALAAGLAALQGRRHGGNTARIDAFFREAGTPERLADMARDRLRRGDAVPGFGHPLYPGGDPRAALLTSLLEAHCPRSEGAAFARAAHALGAHLDAPPALDLALVATCRALGLPEGAPLALFALGRTAGCLAHAREQMDDGRLLRPRARYVGPAPEGGGGS